jgi:hypothetical protein
MKITDELKRVKTREFWLEVRYWSAIKGPSGLTRPVRPEEWSPILMSVVIGVALLFGITAMLKAIFK